eukprot:9481074-Pyramimonas_sp.AAC.2
MTASSSGDVEMGTKDPSRAGFYIIPGVSITSLYGSSCANNGKGALNTPEILPIIPGIQYLWRAHAASLWPDTMSPTLQIAGHP